MLRNSEDYFCDDFIVKNLKIANAWRGLFIIKIFLAWVEFKLAIFQ